MVKRWLVKNRGHKATYLRKEPNQNHGSANVIALVRNGEVVVGEFVYVHRASREAGFVKIKHIDAQCGSSSWKVCNADGSPTTLLRKQPQESHDAANAVGYAMEGEQLEGEFLFVKRQAHEQRGYMRLCHLKAVDFEVTSDVRHAGPEPKGEVSMQPKPVTEASLTDGIVAASLQKVVSGTPQQRWTVMDSMHDGAWMRKTPHSDRSPQNVVCLIANGDVVAGDLVHVRRSNGEEGLVRFRHLEQLPGKVWKVRTASTALERRPGNADELPGIVGYAAKGERVEGQYVLVARKDGKKMGYVKRQYLTALVA